MNVTNVQANFACYNQGCTVVINLFPDLLRYCLFPCHGCYFGGQISIIFNEVIINRSLLHQSGEANELIDFDEATRKSLHEAVADILGFHQIKICNYNKPLPCPPWFLRLCLDNHGNAILPLEEDNLSITAKL